MSDQQVRADSRLLGLLSFASSWLPLRTQRAWFSLFLLIPFFKIDVLKVCPSQSLVFYFSHLNTNKSWCGLQSEGPRTAFREALLCLHQRQIPTSGDGVPGRGLLP